MQARDTCAICKRIMQIKSGKNPFFVAELKTGYVVLGDYQMFEGYTLFLYKNHKEQLSELERTDKEQFLIEMGEVADAVARAFNPGRINCELLGNTDKHLHWHIFPRFENDPAWGKPVWVLPKEERTRNLPTSDKIDNLKHKLRKQLPT